MSLKSAQAYHTPKGDANKAKSTSGKGNNYTSKSLSVNDHVSGSHAAAKSLSKKSR